MSPAATISSADAPDRLLTAADELFYQRGVAAVSMADVRDASGLSMRRLYSLAPSKSDLVAQWLRHRHQTWIAGFRGRIERELAAGSPPIDAFFVALSEWMETTDFRGCGFINTHAESSGLTDEHRSIIRSHKVDFAELLDGFIAAAGLDIEARSLAVLIDGAIVQASIFASTEPIEAAHRVAHMLSTRVGTTPTTTATDPQNERTR